ncbi:Ankyrin-1 [Symbiodinium microadriaticum]|uniref:Ankyrin-1 n=1 Tax=Symbiodinium microadriaticum TaxID=2951 RepID=A0A1Q9EPJ4_SYMMI|nr:Ankyrin-1 [Symbiodinium microadriaticum]
MAFAAQRRKPGEYGDMTGITQAMKQKEFRDHIEEPGPRTVLTSPDTYTREVSDPAHRQEYLDYLAQIEELFAQDPAEWSYPAVLAEAKRVFASKCLQHSRLRATAEAWQAAVREELDGNDEVDREWAAQHTRLADFLTSVDFADWLVPEATPSVKEHATFRDAATLLPWISLTSLTVAAVGLPSSPSLTLVLDGYRVDCAGQPECPLHLVSFDDCFRSPAVLDFLRNTPVPCNSVFGFLVGNLLPSTSFPRPIKNYRSLVKTNINFKSGQKQKCFINIDLSLLPAEAGSGHQVHLPYSLSPPRPDRDLKDEYCMTCDFAVSTGTFQRAAQSSQFLKGHEEVSKDYKVLVTIELQSFLHTLTAKSSPVRALKQHLQRFCGQPRFRQRLLALGDDIVLSDTDDEDILKPGDVQLVLVNFISTSALQGEELQGAAGSGQTSVVETILQRPQDPDVGDPAPLLIASERGHLEVARLLLEAKADKEKVDDTGATPLFIAADMAHLEVARLLLDAEADTEKASNGGTTPLFIAAQIGHLEVARLLLRAKADKEKATNIGATPLFIAAHRGHLEVARLLLDAKANKEKAMRDGATPLFIAARQGHLKVARLLLDAKANMEKATNVGATPLFIAAHRGHFEVARLLLDAKANMDKDENDGGTPLSIASEKEHLQVARLLLDAKTKMDKANKSHGATPLSIAAQKALCSLQRALTVARQIARAVGCSRRSRQFTSFWQEADKGRYLTTSRDASHVESVRAELLRDKGTKSQAPKKIPDRDAITPSELKEMRQAAKNRKKMSGVPDAADDEACLPVGAWETQLFRLWWKLFGNL